MARPRVDAGEYSSSKTFEVPLGGDLDISDEIITGEAIAAAGDLDYQAQLAFLEEKVTVMLATTTDKNVEPMPAVYVNGVSQFFPRGVPVVCRRKFVEGLVRAKPIDYATRVIENMNEDPVNSLTISTAHKYPFHVVHDANPRGQDWLRALMSEETRR